MEGWIKLYRKSYENFLYKTGKPHTRREAWEDILLNVNYETSFWNVGGQKIECKRGQSLMSLESCGKIFNWEKTRVKRFFDLLTKERMIVQENLRKTLRITVCNFEQYQDDRNANATQTLFECNANATQTQSIKEYKEEKESKEYKEAKEDFLAKIISVFQEAYLEVFGTEYLVTNKGKERAAASKIISEYKKKNPEATTADAMVALKNYFTACCGISDDWLRKNMSLPLIVSKFNVINNTLRNGKNKSVASRSGQVDAIIEAVFNNQ
jgi:hypothetical protein